MLYVHLFGYFLSWGLLFLALFDTVIGVFSQLGVERSVHLRLVHLGHHLCWSVHKVLQSVRSLKRIVFVEEDSLGYSQLLLSLASLYLLLYADFLLVVGELIFDAVMSHLIQSLIHLFEKGKLLHSVLLLLGFNVFIALLSQSFVLFPDHSLVNLISFLNSLFFQSIFDQVHETLLIFLFIELTNSGGSCNFSL